MEKIVRVTAVSPMTTFQGQSGNINKIQVTMTDGLDTFVADAYDQTARDINEQGLSEDTVYNVSLQLTLRENYKRETNEKYLSTRIRIIRIAAL